MNTLKNYANFVKFEHTLFSLPLIFAGTFLAAKGLPSWKLLLLIVLAGTGARTAALAINRILDRRIDALNPRTEDRELPSGKVSLTKAYLITILGLILYFVSAYLICDLVLYLSPIPLVVFVLYPLMKRFTPLCHFGVGLGLALAPLGGWVAVTCSLEGILPAVVLSLFTLCWVSGFDIIYATLDEEFDKRAGVYSMVSIYGRDIALRVSSALHQGAFFFIAFLYFFLFKSIVSGLFLILIGVLLFLEHRKAENVDLAFFKINILVGIAIFLFVLSGIYLP
ncbi:MAG: 4-hydroxybenzoate octaprenyltransferase [Thermodesulfobacteriota bacterium]|nr:MAG: 4-hydroxybenzoate octaprenyltransferase [Thermodesulfobacteriota bacterium]